MNKMDSGINPLLKFPKGLPKTMGSHPARPDSVQIVNIQSELQFQRFQSNTKNLQRLSFPIDRQDSLFLLEVINSHCLFSVFPPQMRRECLPLFNKRVYQHGAYIYRQHDTPQELFIIGAGSLSVEIDCIVVKSLKEGQYFGHDSLCFNSGRSESMRVSSKSITIYYMDRADACPLIRRAMGVYKEDIDLIFNRIHFFNYLNNKERRFMMENTTLFRFGKGEVLFESEQEANSFYIVRKGKVLIEIAKLKNIYIKEGEYFGQSAFLSLLNQTSKSQRMGRAVADDCSVEIYAIGLNPLKKCLGHYIRSIIFFNQEKWALYRDDYLSTVPETDYQYLLQLFRVHYGKKYTKLAERNTRPVYIFIPLEAEINTSRKLKIYGSEYLRKQNGNSRLGYDIILTDEGYYACALIQQFKEVLSLRKNQAVVSEWCMKLLQQPLYLNMTLTLRNVSKFAQKVPSNGFGTILVVEDMKFGNEFVVKIYQKKTKKQGISSPSLSSSLIGQSFKEIESLTLLEQQQQKVQLQTKTNANFNFIPFYEEDKCMEQKPKQFVSQQQIANQKHLLSRLCNKYICGYYKSQQDSDNYYLFTEFVKGSTLEQILDCFGVLPRSLVKFYLASLAAALDYLHSQNVIHRNMGCRNILISIDGCLSLVDLSCAKMVHSHKRSNTLIGNPYYTAPEMIGEDGYSFGVDLWAMGVVLYEMITGELPFGCGLSDPVEIYESILHDELNLKKILHKKEIDIIRALLQKDPSKRMVKPLQIRKMEYINDLQFEWNKFQTQSFDPPYFPKQNRSMNTKVNIDDYIDVCSIEDWE